MVYYGPSIFWKRICLDTSRDQVNSLSSSDQNLVCPVLEQDFLSLMERFIAVLSVEKGLAQCRWQVRCMSSETLQHHVRRTTAVESGSVRVIFNVHQKGGEQANSLDRNKLFRSRWGTESVNATYCMRRGNTGMTSRRFNLHANVNVPLFSRANHGKGPVILKPVGAFETLEREFAEKNPKFTYHPHRQAKRRRSPHTSPVKGRQGV